MRLTFALSALVLIPSVSGAQTATIDDAVKANLAAVKFVQGLQDPSGGFYPGPADPKAKDGPKPSLRATSAAVRALKYLTGKPVKDAVPNVAKVTDFVMSCYDPKTGGFADAPGGKADVTLTSVGVMAAVELDVPREKFAKALDYLKANAKSFEEVRLAAAAVEAWGLAVGRPFDLAPWFKVAADHGNQKLRDPKDGDARETGSLVAMYLRLGEPLPAGNTAADILKQGQLEDGGWKKAGAKGSDLETTYRVMRAFHLLKTPPNDVAKLRAFLAACRNKDGGYGVAPGQPSTVGAVYYAAIITKWLDEMEKR